MKIRELTCIVCPRGCALSVQLSDDGQVLGVTGNICKRGATYAYDECINPMRVVTSTVRLADGSVVSCKTASSIPKSLVFDAMKVINATTVTGSVKIGDVLISDILGTGVDVVATSNK